MALSPPLHPSVPLAITGRIAIVPVDCAPDKKAVDETTKD